MRPIATIARLLCSGLAAVALHGADAHDHAACHAKALAKYDTSSLRLAGFDPNSLYQSMFGANFSSSSMMLCPPTSRR